MKTKRRALGKGLRSLIRERPPQPAPKPPVAARPGQGLEQIDLDRISPNPEQPRQQFDQANLEQLAASLRRDGLLQPVIVRPRVDGGFELIAGERRWRAAQLAGLMKIPALIRKVGDEQMLELALIENLQRDDLNPLEAAHAFQSLIDDLGLTQEEVAGRVGKKRATISNILRLLHLPREIQEKIESGELTLGHAGFRAQVRQAAVERPVLALEHEDRRLLDRPFGLPTRLRGGPILHGGGRTPAHDRFSRSGSSTTRSPAEGPGRPAPEIA